MITDLREQKKVETKISEEEAIAALKEYGYEIGEDVIGEAKEVEVSEEVAKELLESKGFIVLDEKMTEDVDAVLEKMIEEKALALAEAKTKKEADTSKKDCDNDEDEDETAMDDKKEEDKKESKEKDKKESKEEDKKESKEEDKKDKKLLAESLLAGDGINAEAKPSSRKNLLESLIA